MTNPPKLCLDKDWLYQKYIIEELSTYKIAEIIGCQQETVARWLKRHDIPIRSGSEAHSGKLHWNYGKHHSEETKKKISETNTGNNYSETDPERCKRLSEHFKGSGNPRYGVKLSEDQIERQKRSLLETYKSNPKLREYLSIKRKEYYSLHPEAGKIHSQKIIIYYSDENNRKKHSERCKEYYINNPLSEEEKRKRTSYIENYYRTHPDARKKHSNYMKLHNPSQDPEVAEKISYGMKMYHKDHPNPVGTGYGHGAHYNNIWLRSSYEIRYAGILDALNIKWEYEHGSFWISSLEHTYRPDFYLPEYDLWIEVKGYFKEFDIIKTQKFYEEYPNINLKIIYLEHLNSLEHEIFATITPEIYNYGISIKQQINEWSK